MVPAAGFQPNFNPRYIVGYLTWIFRHDFDGIQIHPQGFDLLSIHGMDAASSGLSPRIVERCLDQRAA
jgi:hypothetical protein